LASDRVSGSYSGITSVGTLSQLIVTGISTVNALEIDGAVYDSSNSVGLANSVFTSIGTAAQWKPIPQQIIGYGLTVPSNSLGNDGDFYVVHV
jgi:hypothetical protein